MDRFLDTTLSGGTGDQYDPTHSRPLGYYDQTDLPYLLRTGDAVHHRRSPGTLRIPANTVPNRMYLFAATSYGHAFPPTSPNDPAWQRPTIFRALHAAGINWRYYYQDNSVFLANWADWNDPEIQANVRNIQEYYNILASPNADQDLPQVVFIERASSTGYDEHPGQQCANRISARRERHQRAACQRCLARLCVHPDLGRRRRSVRSRWTDPGYASWRFPSAARTCSRETKQASSTSPVSACQSSWFAVGEGANGGASAKPITRRS